MPDRKFDLLVAGEINPDLILSGNVLPEFGQIEKIVDSAVLSIGSSSAIFACGAARLGLKVAFIGKCGDDTFGRFMLEEMRKRQVDVENVIVEPGAGTGLSVILSTGTDRAILTSLGLIPALRADDISDALLRQSRHLHVASYFLQDALRPGLPALFGRARALGLTTSLDTNYDPSEQWRGFEELLAVTNLFFPNETEAKSLTGQADIHAAADCLRDKTEIVAIKLGAQGALGIRGPETIKVDSIPVSVADTVGAGDSFAAGFIYGYLQSWDLERSLRLACICGALSTRLPGGTTAQPTLEEALEYA
jgi:sugar/nucleoside kinase (ribokinase family)